MSYHKNSQIIFLLRNSLKEDIGRGDITTELIIPKHKFTRAVLLTKENCVVCGLGTASMVFKLQDKKIKFKPLVYEGRFVKKGTTLAKIEGNARSILTAERVVLNFLSLLSGIATKTKKYVEAVKPYKIRIMDTRKTIPGLRELEKYAVRIGGGYNHRMRLDEMVLVKDNHLKVAGGYQGLSGVIRGYQVELEVKNLREFKQALKLNPDVIMLDNMSIKDIKRAVKIRNHPVELEASGGITLKNVKKIASAGVDMISIGDLTHSIESIDLSLEVL